MHRNIGRPFFSSSPITSPSFHSPTSTCQASNFSGIVLQDGWSPLMIALDKGHIDVVRTLIEAGADVNQTDKVSVCALLFYFISVHFALVPPVPIYMSARFSVLNIKILSTTTTLDCLGLKCLLIKHVTSLFSYILCCTAMFRNVHISFMNSAGRC